MLTSVFPTAILPVVSLAGSAAPSAEGRRRGGTRSPSTCSRRRSTTVLYRSIQAVYMDTVGAYIASRGGDAVDGITDVEYVSSVTLTSTLRPVPALTVLIVRLESGVLL